jgi:hypothetical protein
MSLDVLATLWRSPLYSLAVLAVLAGVLALGVRAARRACGKVPAAVLVAALGAMLATAYSSDTSWRFARDHLGMTSTAERVIMFGAAEVALFAMALMARQNLRVNGAPGTPGVLVWAIVGVQVIPAYSESGFVAGTVRAFVGPVMSALLWHLAMGIELRHASGTDSQSLPAILARELRERLLSRLGLAVRGRDAAQITRDRWTRIATHRAARLADLEATGGWSWRIRRARRRLAAAVDHTDAGVLAGQRTVLLDRIAAYRHAPGLASVDLPSPWHTPATRVEAERVPGPQPVPEVQGGKYPQLAAGVPAAQPAPRWVSVPAGARLLPIVPAETRQLAGVLAAESPRTRLEVHAGYVPEADEYAQPDDPDNEPHDDSPPPPGEDTLTAQARADFLPDLVSGATPSIRTLKTRYGIGQPRATRIRDELTKGLAA